jgi:hypothetical protein
MRKAKKDRSRVESESEEEFIGLRAGSSHRLNFLRKERMREKNSLRARKQVVEEERNFVFIA